MDLGTAPVALVMMVGPLVAGLGGIDLRRMQLRKRGVPRGEGKRLLRRVRSVMQWGLVAAGVTVFSISLFEPAAENVSGLWALVLGFPFWGVNAWFLLSPIVLIRTGRSGDAWMIFIPLMVQVVCAVAASSTVDGRSGLFPGHAHWVVAQWLVVGAYAVPAVMGGLLGFGEIGER